jgi:biotin operon repressor
MTGRQLTPDAQARIDLIMAGKSPDEVAVQLGTTRKAVHRTIQRARAAGHRVFVVRAKNLRGASRPLLAPDVTKALSGFSKARRKRPHEVASELLRAVLIEHPQIARNLIDPEPEEA